VYLHFPTNRTTGFDPIRKESLEQSYTKYNDPLINKTIACQLTEISNRIITEVKDVISLFLIGGYARGEGSVLIEDGKIVPLGDYDFLAISRFPHFPRSFSWLESMQKKFRVQYHIGVDIVWKSLLPFLQKRIYWYESKFGSRLLFGDKSVLDLVPISGGSDVDLKEGFSLMSNRLMGLLKMFDFKFLDYDPSKEQRQHLIFQSAKAVLSCGESLLLLNHNYHFSYEERLRRLSKSFKNDFDELLTVDLAIKEDYEKATYFKLKPEFEMYRDCIKFWFTAKQHVLQTLSFFIRKTMLGANSLSRKLDVSDDIDFFPKFLLRTSKPELLDFMKFNCNAIKYLKSLTGLRPITTSYSDIVRASLFYLALAVKENGDVDGELLDKALILVGRIVPTSRRINEEKDLRKKWQSVRNIVYLAWTLARQ